MKDYKCSEHLQFGASDIIVASPYFLSLPTIYFLLLYFYSHFNTYHMARNISVVTYAHLVDSKLLNQKEEFLKEFISLYKM